MANYKADQLAATGYDQTQNLAALGPAEKGRKASSLKVVTALAVNDTVTMNTLYMPGEVPAGQHMLWIDNLLGATALSGTMRVGLANFGVNNAFPASRVDATGAPLKFMNPSLDGDYLATQPPVAPGDAFFGNQVFSVPANSRVSYPLFNALPLLRGWLASPDVVLTLSAGAIPVGALITLELNTVKL